MICFSLLKTNYTNLAEVDAMRLSSINIQPILLKFLLCIAILQLSACSSISYFSHLFSGQVALLWKRQDVQGLVDSPETSDVLRQRLVLSQKIRVFAADSLELPVGDAYTAYTDLERPFAVWNIYAAPELSLESHTWCYPILGCLAYRGYYDEARAKSDAQSLASQGFETRVGGVRAYSTLGVFDDPLLNTFMFTDEVYLVELLIHEISHRKLYISDDTMFNENFATAVATLGAQQWYKKEGLSERYQDYQTTKISRTRVLEHVMNFKERLAEVYKDETLSIEEKRQQKKSLFQALRKQYKALKAEYALDDRYDAWLANLNNASLATLSNYQALVPAFIALFNELGQDWSAFYERVESIAGLEKSVRHQRLNDLIQAKEL